jgi:hypothetical protein
MKSRKANRRPANMLGTGFSTGVEGTTLITLYRILCVAASRLAHNSTQPYALTVLVDEGNAGSATLSSADFKDNRC